MRRLSVMILYALLFPLAAASAVDGKELKLVLPESAGTAVRQIAAEFKAVVESRTGGALKIVVDGKAPFKDNEIIGALGAGQVEIGGTTLDQFSSDVGLARIFLQPFMFNFTALIKAAARPGGEIRALIDEEILRGSKAHVLWWQPNGANILVSKGAPATLYSRGEPAVVVSITNIPNLPVGAPEGQSSELTKACGGTAHALPTAKLYSAFEADKIRVAMTDIFSVQAYDLWRVADTILNTQHSPSLYVVAINDAAWRALSPEHRGLVTAAANEIQDTTWERFAAIEAAAYALAKKNGMTVHELSSQDVEDWRACSSPLLEAYMEKIGEPGRKLFAAYGKLRTDPCCRQPPISVQR